MFILTLPLCSGYHRREWLRQWTERSVFLRRIAGVKTRIGFTQRLFSLSEPIEAVKKLNADYGLHIVVRQAPTTEEVSEYHKRIAKRRAYDEWEHNAWKTLHDYLWLMREWMDLVPESPDDVQDRRFVYSLHHLDWADWLCDEFLHTDRSGELAIRDTIKNMAEINRKAVHNAPP